MRRASRSLPIVLAAVALLALLAYGVAAQGPDSGIDEAIEDGKRVEAPSRELPVLGSDARGTIEAHRGKVVVLNFWASWCEPCREEAPVLERVHRRYRARGVQVLGVTFRDATPDSQQFAREYRLTYPSLRDIDGKLAGDYGTVALPETFVIDRRGRIASVSRGTVTAAFLERTLNRLLREAA